ncbi:hypothetical protein L6452_37192 [Arctium lappa]|uniref:Uncharacterized protein n=1 Tax=Arctium lappa TaxID=4217 RepID=A0ACB8Y2T8_ARCLA|nr:hypothetical protein L6452_37192 [Arctium lappa]
MLNRSFPRLILLTPLFPSLSVMETSNQLPIPNEPTIHHVAQVGIANQGEADDVMMEEVVADESMEEAATASDAQPMDKGKNVMEIGGTS